METKTIGKFISTLRKANGYTQTQLAEMLGVSNKTISNWENEVSYPDLSLIPVIADLFGVTSDELLRGEKDRIKNINEQYIETKTTKLKDNIKKNLMNQYSNNIYISLGILFISYLFLFLGLLLIKSNNGIYLENEKELGIIFLVLGLLVYCTGLVFSIINSNNFINKLDQEDDNSDLLFFHLKKNLLLECLYGFIVLSPFFISVYNNKILNDSSYKVSEELKNKINYNNKLKLKVGSIFTSIGIVIGIGVLVLNSLSIDQFEMKKYDDSVLQNEGKFEVNVYDDSFSIKSLSEIHSKMVHKFDYNLNLQLENKIYEIKTLFKNYDELENFAEQRNYQYSIDGFVIEFPEDLDRMFIRYDSDIIIVLYKNDYKDYVIYSDDYLELYDVGNNQFKSITSHTYYVRDIWFSFTYLLLISDVTIGFVVYFSKKKYLSKCN